MNISKFELIDSGFGGIKIESQEASINKEKVSIMDTVKRERKIPLPPDLRSKIQKVTYFYLNLTGHWISVYDAYVDDDYGLKKPSDNPKASEKHLRELWNATEIISVSAKGDGFVIEGLIESVEGKVVKIKTPKIVEDDDYSFYYETMDLIHDIVKSIVDYFTADIFNMLQPKNIIKELMPKLDKEESLKLDGMTETEAKDWALDVLESHGAIVMMQEEVSNKKAIGGSTEVKSTKTVNMERFDDVDQEDDKPDSVENDSNDDQEDEGKIIVEEDTQW